jgi:hypothetical protein
MSASSIVLVHAIARFANASQFAWNSSVNFFTCSAGVPAGIFGGGGFFQTGFFASSATAEPSRIKRAERANARIAMAKSSHRQPATGNPDESY